MKESKVIIMSLILLTLVGGPAVYSVVKMPEPVVGEAMSANSRQPASVSGQKIAVANADEPRNALKARSVTMDFSCDQKEQTVETDGSHVRLKSLACKMAPEQNVTVVNRANGYTASVIFTKNEQFTTDFIELSEGENKIEIQSENSHGKKMVQHLILKRRAPASVPVSVN